MPKKNEPIQRTLADLNDLRLPETTQLEAEWTDAAGYHRAPVTGAWESESGSVVLTVGEGHNGQIKKCEYRNGGKSMKRIISLILLVAVMVGVFGTACGGEWADYSDGIVNNAETVIGDLREECAGNGGKLEKERIELFYRFYQLWISAKQVRAMASVDYHTIVVMDKMDPYATSQKVAAETWGKYLSGEVDAEKMVQVLIALTDEIGK